MSELAVSRAVILVRGITAGDLAASLTLEA